MALIIHIRPKGLVFEKNIPDLVIEAGDGELQFGFKLKIGSTVVLEEEYKFDADGFATIRRLDEIISAYFAAKTTVESGLVITTGLLVNAQIAFDTNAQSNGDDEFHPALEYGWSFSAIRCEADMPTGLNAGTFAAENFLTRLPREKRTATNRNEYLTFIHFDNYGSVIVKYKAYYISSTGVYTDKTGNFLTVAAGTGDRHITFNASLAAVRTAAALPTEEILQYDLWFTESALEIQSNAFTFLPDPNHYRDKKYFVFENSFGVLESFTAIGTTENKISNEYNLANIQSRYRKTTQDFVSEKTSSTGFLSTDEMEWLNDLLLSYNVGFYLPGISGISEELTLTGHEKTDTDENLLQAFKFNYRRAKNNHLQFAAAAAGIFDTTFDTTFE